MTPLEKGILEAHDIGARTREAYAYYVRDFLKFAGEDPSNWRLRTVESWLAYLLNERKLQAQTVRVYRKAIRYASARYATLEERPDWDFAHNASKLKARPSKPREPLSYEEASKLLATCDNSLEGLRDRTLLILALRTGLRREGMRSLDIDGIRPPRITTINKGGDDITFEADVETFAALGAWLRVLHGAGITSGAVFRTIKRGAVGERMSAFQIYYVFNSRADAAGIRHVFPHLARHTTVTWLREAGKTAAEVSRLTGQTEKTIEDIYTHVRTNGAVSDAIPSLLPPKR